METNLINFYKNITKINKDICKYEDEKGNYYLIPTSQLIANCEYKEFTKQEYEQARFGMIVEKDVDLDSKKVHRTVDKYTRTGKDKDKGTLIESEVMVKYCWIVKNAIGISKTFNKKEEALKLVEELNNETLIMAEIK